jgi:hypothetical protein
MTRTIKAWLLFFFLSLCASAVVVTHQVRSQLPPPVPRELFAIVEQQLAAFRADDYRSAYRHAASEVQQKFTIPQFESMIRRDYGDMTNAQHVEFGLVNVNGSNAVVQVFLLAPNGSNRSFLYSLIAEGNSWKINGVQPGPSASPNRQPPGLHI